MRAAVVTASAHATRAAAELLRDGGNAVDAAVAAAWALGVCEPSGSGLGGQCVMLIARPDGEIAVVDGSSYAPEAASPAAIDRAAQHVGHRACTIPSLPAALELARSRFGRASLERVLAPAVALAYDGYPVGRLQHRDTRLCARFLRDDAAAAETFLRDGEAPPVGTTFRQPLLAGTLTRLAREGVDDFYRGGTARTIAADHARAGGLLRLADLAGYAAHVRAPVCAAYRDGVLATAPAPAGGPVLMSAAHTYERVATARAGDVPDYVSLARAVHDAFSAREHASLGAAESGTGETTHVCVADDEGGVVSLTSSIQSLFGAKVAAAGLGFVYNNYLTTSPRAAHRHALRGGCVPRSNASPAFVLDSTGRVRLALGAAGSRRIISGMLHVLTAVVDRAVDVVEAVAEPRVHATLRGDAWIERPAASDATLCALREQFANVTVRAPHSWSMGCVHAIAFGSDGAARAAADPRREGVAA